MANLKEKLGRVLAKKYHGAAVELKLRRPGNSIIGALVWDGFQGQDQVDRQVALRQAIDKAVTGDERAKVSFIMTLTPYEKKTWSQKNGSPSKSKKPHGR